MDSTAAAMAPTAAGAGRLNVELTLGKLAFEGVAAPGGRILRGRDGRWMWQYPGDKAPGWIEKIRLYRRRQWAQAARSAQDAQPSADAEHGAPSRGLHAFVGGRWGALTATALAVACGVLIANIQWREIGSRVQRAGMALAGAAPVEHRVPEPRVTRQTTAPDAAARNIAGAPSQGGAVAHGAAIETKAPVISEPPATGGPLPAGMSPQMAAAAVPPAAAAASAAGLTAAAPAATAIASAPVAAAPGHSPAPARARWQRRPAAPVPAPVPAAAAHATAPASPSAPATAPQGAPTPSVALGGQSALQLPPISAGGASIAPSKAPAAQTAAAATGVILNEGPAPRVATVAEAPAGAGGKPRAASAPRLVAVPNDNSILVPDAQGVPRVVKVGSVLPNGARLLSADPRTGVATTDAGALRLE